MKIKNKILGVFQQRLGESLTQEQLAKILGIQKKDRHLFFAALTQMKQENLIYQKKNGAYALVQKAETFVGIIRTHKKGFGFIIVDGEDDDFFVRQQDMGGALDGDVVHFEKFKDPMYPDKEAARVVSIKERANHRQVGTIIAGNKTYFGVALDSANFKGKVLVAKKGNVQLVVGHKVVITPEEYEDGDVIIARVVEVLGHENTPGMDILSIVKQYDIPIEFSAAVEQQVAGVPSEVSVADFAGREDLRKRLTITIDGADAKDLDDAVSLEKLANGNYYLSVHIADVSHYVQEDSPIDEEALTRGTSVYLADRVIPMLPVQLSNGICSLHPHVDRLTITAEMEITPQGQMIAKRIIPSVIYSDERMTYDDVNQILKKKDAALIARYQNIYPMLQEMYTLAKILQHKRHENGALDFAMSEAKIIVDKNGKAIDIKVRQQDVAEEIIEQFMIMANEAVAEYFSQNELPAIYRVHGTPQDVKLDAFRQAASNMGVNISKIKNTANVKPKALQQLLEKIQAKTDYNLLSTLLLRTMQKAEYSTTNIGHFGLAMWNYTHFTSPIRRYPDLIVHRLLRHYLFTGHANELADEKMTDKLKEIAHETSVAERRAIECERAVTNMKMAEYMQDHIGEEYTGVINGVISSGFFVELDNLVEGKVGMESLKDDYYIFMPEHLMLFGRRTKKEYRMGDKVKVKVESANKELAEINFSLLAVEKRPGGSPKRKPNEGKDKRGGAQRGKAKGGNFNRNKAKDTKDKPHKNKKKRYPQPREKKRS